MQVLGISFDTEAENAAFAEKFSFPYPLLCDTSREIGLAYGACESADASHAKRYTFVIDGQGAIAHAIDTKDPAGQADAVLGLL